MKKAVLLLSFVQGEAVPWNRDESPIVFDRMENGSKSKQPIICETDKHTV